MSKLKGGFTMPGEAGYEKLTLELAEKWGADVIRDSDGTALSPEILNSGYDIYSTICIIRDHNEWAKENLEKLQQTFLITSPVTATGVFLEISLMKDFFKEQFKINESKESLEYWEVYDRTENKKLDNALWHYDAGKETVIVSATPFHNYTVSFIAFRIWEEISMYNHTTNNWDKEHLMQIDPMYEGTRIYLKKWMKEWCEKHPATKVVRFTSLFYNFVWIFGSSKRMSNIFSDWASYDFTVSTEGLRKFEEKYGYKMTAEDFVNGGKFHVTHMPSTKEKRDWMEFINDFVIYFAKELIEIVHSYGKKAYVFYDDSWVGLEPYNERFKEFGFDGLIKCVFSGFEVRLCGGVNVPTHEIRLHPYLFPVGLGGLPTFKEGGNPTLDAKKYWLHVRRALLRTKIDRIGLGGYIHLVEDFPDFVDYIEKISDEFRVISSLHEEGAPATIPVKVKVLTHWGALRSWTLSGHFHETFMHSLIHVNEALSGLPVDVSYICFEDIKNGALKDTDLLINAGRAGSAWSGGDSWKDSEIVTRITEWVYNGGTFLGIKEPSATDGFDTYFRLENVLGVDKDLGDRVCHGKYGILSDNVFISHDDTVIIETDGKYKATRHPFGKGFGIYMEDFEVDDASTRMLLELILEISAKEKFLYITDNKYCECAYFEGSNTLVVINNSEEVQKTTVETKFGRKTYTIEPFDTVIESLTGE